MTRAPGDFVKSYPIAVSGCRELTYSETGHESHGDVHTNIDAARLESTSDEGDY